LGILGVKMEPSDFVGWLTALTWLNAAQRRIVFRELALAEADDPCEEGIEIFAPGPAAGDADRAEERGEATATAFCESGARDIFREIAKERHSRWGCPRCGSLPARGAKREVCRAIAASNAARLSIRSPALRWPACTRRIAGSIRREPWSKGRAWPRRPSVARSTRAPPSGGGIGFSPLSSSTNPRAFRASSKPMRPSFSSRSRVGGAVLPDQRVAAAAKPPSAASR